MLRNLPASLSQKPVRSHAEYCRHQMPRERLAERLQNKMILTNCRQHSMLVVSGCPTTAEDTIRSNCLRTVLWCQSVPASSEAVRRRTRDPKRPAAPTTPWSHTHTQHHIVNILPPSKPGRTECRSNTARRSLCVCSSAQTAMGSGPRGANTRKTPGEPAMSEKLCGPTPADIRLSK